MAVKAKFTINEITHSKYGAGWANPAPVGRVKLSAASGKGNEEWAAATPGGSVDLTIGNPDALEFFNKNLGETIEITFGEVN
jgi:hypothetical protein